MTETLENTIAFPKLDDTELEQLRALASSCSFTDGQTVFRAGDADLDLFVVESGAIEIINPSDDNRHVVRRSGPHAPDASARQAGGNDGLEQPLRHLVSLWRQVQVHATTEPAAARLRA